MLRRIIKNRQKKTAATAAAFIIAAEIITGVTTNAERTPFFAITSEAANSEHSAPNELNAAAEDKKITFTLDKATVEEAYISYICDKKIIYSKGNGSAETESEPPILKGCISFYTPQNSDASFVVSIKISGEKIYKDGEIIITIGNNNPEIKYEASINEGKNWTKAVENNISFEELSSGKYKILIREENSEEYICSKIESVTKVITKRAKYIPIPMILQLPELPTGCEVTSLAMLLNHLGFKENNVVLADKYLIKGKYRASDPNEVFVGDPKSVYAYGCFSKVIVKTAEKYLEKNDTSKKYSVRNITGCSPESLYAALDNGYPVIVWVTMGLSEPRKGTAWTIPDSKKQIQWIAGEHCVLLTGYDISKKLVYVNDPLKGTKAYDMKLFEKRFEQMNRNAVIITHG